jgi:hypothetical protein
MVIAKSLMIAPPARLDIFTLPRAQFSLQLGDV